MAKDKFIKLLLFHMVIGVLLFVINPLSKIYFVSILFYFIYKIFSVKVREKHLYVLYACAYIIGSEVFLRMTKGNFFYETSKYLIIVFSVIGFFVNGISKKSLIYVLYLVLLIPGIVVATVMMGFETNIRTAIAFNLSGPVALGVFALYCYDRKLTISQINKVLLNMLLPLVSTLVYLFLYTPDIQDVVTGTQSNFATSGGFGPNQVATVLGLGIFILATRFFTFNKSFLIKSINVFLLLFMSFRAIITFSRGGIFTAIIIIIAFLVIYYRKSKKVNKAKLLQAIAIFTLFIALAWFISSIQTLGFIDKRYANQDASGREKEDITTGRSQLISFELNEFIKNPFLGVGVGKIKELRFQEERIYAASHNEVSRILSEHGLFGVFALLVLLIAPLVFRINNRKNIYFYSFYLFWFLTINHSSMRIAAPSFIYGLSLLNITYEKSPIHRKRAIAKR